MPTEFLCTNCQLPGTSYSEQGKGVTIAPEAHEAVRFFHLDCEAFRNHLGLDQEVVCDLLIEYCREKAMPVDLFAELKGAGGIDRAKKQIVGAFAVLEKDLRACQRAVRFRAIVVTSGNAPPNGKKLVSELTKTGFEAVWFKTGVKRGGMVDLRKYVV